MKVAIHQPQYLPWLGYFDKIEQADIFVLLDDVQYKKNEWQNRNRIRNADGWQWLTVPVEHEFGQKINEVTIDAKSPWRKKHLKSIELNYSGSRFFGEYSGRVEEVLSRDWKMLTEINKCFIFLLCGMLGIGTEIITSSAMGIESASTARLVDICKKLGADVYLSGAGGREYLDQELFRRNDIELEFQEYEHPEYKQVFKGFYPYMSVLDLLFCEGKESLNIIKKGRK